jgi:hypothetical protein
VRYIPKTETGVPLLELSRRNLQALLDKLDDPKSARMLVDPDRLIAVVAVEDDEHYSDRAPGVVFMPSSGEIR